MKGLTAETRHSILQKLQGHQGLIRILIIAFLSGLGIFLWLLLWDTTPPSIELVGIEPEVTCRGNVKLDIRIKDEKSGLDTPTLQFDDAPPRPLKFYGGAEHWSLFGGWVNVEGQTAWTLDTRLIPDGKYTVSVTATDRSLRKNTTKQSLTFYVDNTPPQFYVPPESLQAWQGKTLGIFVQTDEPVRKITGRLLNREITFYRIASGNLYRGLMGIGVTQPPKHYTLTLNAIDRVGNTAEGTFQVSVKETVFERGGYIVLSPEKQKIMMDKSKSREDNAKRGKAYAKLESEQLWAGKFIRPTEGRLTSPFGKYREYNTGVKRHHLGTDIANIAGTPVYAVNHGVVTLADRLHIYGNAVILNHGQGVSTSYNHLSEIHVKVGDQVEKGQRIGLMGATGQVTASHLHWGMVVNGVAVDPEAWVEEDYSAPKAGEIDFTPASAEK